MIFVITIFISCLLLLLLLYLHHSFYKRQPSCSSFSLSDKIHRYRRLRVLSLSALFRSCSQNSAMPSATSHSAASLLVHSKKKNELKEKGHLKMHQNSEGSPRGLTGRGRGDSKTMLELRKKIMSFRDNLDLPPCSTSASVLQLVIVSVKDLHKLYPDIVPKYSMSEKKGTSMNQALNALCDAMRAVGDMWTHSNKWMIESTRYSLVNADLEQLALSMLDDMIKLVKEKMSVVMDDDEDEDIKDCVSLANASEISSSEFFTDKKSPQSDSPLTPTSVLPSPKASSSPSPSRLLPLRVQAVGKLNPIDLKRLSFHFPQEASKSFHPLNDMYKTVEETKAETETKKNNEEAIDAIEVDKVDNITNNSEKYLVRGLVVQERSDPKSTPSIQPMSSPKGSPLSAESSASTCSSVIPISGAESSPRSSSGVETMSSSECSARCSSTAEQIEAQKLPNSPSTSVIEVARPPSPSSKPVALATPPSLLVQKEPSNSPTPKTEERISSQLPSPKSPESTAISPPPPPIKSIAAPPALPLESIATPPPPPPPSIVMPPPMESIATPPPPPPPSIATPPPPPPPSIAIPLPPPPPMESIATPPPPPPPSIAMPPPPPPPMTKGNMAAPPPPPPPIPSNGSAPAPPPPMPLGNGAAPPPPPGGGKLLRAKKANSKLKRSSQIGNLYRQLKGKVEGSSLKEKSAQGRKSNNSGASSSGSQGTSMADALAEMTKRSSYFQQIEEDVRNHTESIKEVRKSLSTFQATDMKELLKFHKNIESVLEKLTDESQVLARFEEFPVKKLEAVRMAAALYSKLEGIVTTLETWKIASPLNQLLDRVENYFTKIKSELDTLERTKDEESKKFQSHKIQFDFGILVRIKELMVDVSANCMELALKERREAKAKQMEECKSKSENKKMVSAKMLWRAFQFAFRVYTFAGGHDDRADKLTRELAHEIETDPQ